MNQNDAHARLLLPYDPPLPETLGGRLPSVPQLWERARLFFSRVISHIGSTSSLSRRWRLSRKEKKDILGWLEPAEKVARSCLLVRALNFLMMTPEGCRLIRETPKIAMPEPAKTGSTTPRVTHIPHGGWHTHAPYARALAERRKLEEQKAAERAARDRHDPANWGGSFRVVGWSMPEGEGRPPPKKKLPQWAMLLTASLDPDPVCAYRTRHEPKKKPDEKDAPALILARRIQALARVVDNPEPAVKRLARFIARLPREALELLKDIACIARSYWTQGDLDARLAAAHVRQASAAYCYIQPG
jgi:hypothetical protein